MRVKAQELFPKVLKIETIDDTLGEMRRIIELLWHCSSDVKPRCAADGLLMCVNRLEKQLREQAQHNANTTD